MRWIVLYLCWQLCDVALGGGWLEDTGGTWLPLVQLPKCLQGMGDLRLQEEGDAGSEEVGPSDGFGAAL